MSYQNCFFIFFLFIIVFYHFIYVFNNILHVSVEKYDTL
ncbi:hypothetical protein EUBDOL_01538 [Amedibacillus dolichus DSM 3991]|uniref:Uncharacterized protein n=1 Tax=Amedibacillus dolichus DSM 3991 TaxID=428127 RepID=A8RCY6_9FIRM|nr:hypothetical protein EUBDOL_01538 [Amedibacillus dolichus DSM 3991]